MNLISTCAAMLASRALAVLLIIMSCGMKTTSLLMDCRRLPTTSATPTQGALVRYQLFHLHIMLIWLPSVPVSTWSHIPLTVDLWQMLLEDVDRCPVRQHHVVLGPQVVELLGHFQL